MSINDLIKRLIDGKTGYCTNAKIGMKNYEEAVRSLGALAAKKAERHGISLHAISKMTSVNRDTISNFFIGKTVPNVVNAIVISRATVLLAEEKQKKEMLKLDALAFEEE